MMEVHLFYNLELTPILITANGFVEIDSGLNSLMKGRRIEELGIAGLSEKGSTRVLEERF